MPQVEQLETEQQVPPTSDQGVIPFHAPPLTDSPPPPRVNGTAPVVRAAECGCLLGALRVCLLAYWPPWPARGRRGEGGIFVSGRGWPWTGAHLAALWWCDDGCIASSVALWPPSMQCGHGCRLHFQPGALSCLRHLTPTPFTSAVCHRRRRSSSPRRPAARAAPTGRAWRQLAWWLQASPQPSTLPPRML